MVRDVLFVYILNVLKVSVFAELLFLNWHVWLAVTVLQLNSNLFTGVLLKIIYTLYCCRSIMGND